MKIMKREMTFVLLGLAAVSLLVWFFLPVYSFIFIVPLFNISGWSLSLTINQLMLFALFGGILMVVAAVINNRKLMIVAGVLEVIIVILTFIFRKNILLEGNFKWIYSSATLLVKKLPEIVGVDTSSWNIQEIVTYAIDNLLQPGLGLIIHGICVLAYTIIAFCASGDKGTSVVNRKNTNQGGSITSNNTNTVIKHENTGFNHRT